MKDVPIPSNLLGNDRDRRGFPIPFVVYRDMDGEPHFTVDDIGAFNTVLSNHLCGLCGKPLQPGQLWMIGGPISAFREEGMYIEPPAHEECARYAVRVCPFIAAPSYSRRIEAKTLKHAPLHDMAEVHDNKIAPPRPPFFALTRTTDITLIDSEDVPGQKYILPLRPWKDVEFWRHAERIGLREAEMLCRDGGLPPDQLKWWPA